MLAVHVPTQELHATAATPLLFGLMKLDSPAVAAPIFANPQLNGGFELGSSVLDDLVPEQEKVEIDC